MATFRCKRSGNTVTFTKVADIVDMRKHEGYDEIVYSPLMVEPDDVKYEHPEVIEAKVIEPVAVECEQIEQVTQVKAVKTRGRPRKNS